MVDPSPSRIRTNEITNNDFVLTESSLLRNNLNRCR